MAEKLRLKPMLSMRERRKLEYSIWERADLTSREKLRLIKELDERGYQHNMVVDCTISLGGGGIEKTI